MLVMVWRAMRGIITLGDLALFYQAFNQGLGLTHTLLSNVGRLYENTLFLGNLFEFLALKSQISDPIQPVGLRLPIERGIRFRNVSFQYPGAERSVLHEFDLSIHPNETIAIVGPNGAGKSTLVKLLCRFYDPDAGAIEVDGVDLRGFSLMELRRAISVGFQQTVHYDATAAENIGYGNLAEMKMVPIETAARQAGADEIITRLPDGLGTHLGKYFMDGTELSIGEWQRIGLARAYFRDAPIIVLDEPTGAMDPWAEIEWGERFREFTRGRIGILVTHRFTTAMFADLIHVMEAGRIVESGTHDALLRAGGLYARGWAAQARA
jgi:ATP-binding cassette subfamily B protein